METHKKKRLEREGWAVGSAADFLELRSEEAIFIEWKLALAAGLRETRERSGLTQTEVAAKLRLSQCRVAKLQAGDRPVPLDIPVKSLLHLGASPAAIARWIEQGETNRAA
jgi:predicted XRE-type DNA-binding protein